MITALSEAEIRRLRMKNQGLGGHEARPPSVQAATSRVVGLQAQEELAAALSVRGRTSGLSLADVRRAREEERSVVRTWLLRGTLHLVASEDLPWLLPLLAPRFLLRGTRRREELGVDAHVLEKSRGVIVRALAGGPLGRRDVVAALRRAGLPAEGQAPIHIIRQAALSGLVCYGPKLGREDTFVLLRDWIDYRARPASEVLLHELAARYLAGFGPATPEDLAAWSGLELRQARRGWELLAPRLVEIPTPWGPLWSLAAQRDAEAVPRSHTVRLLGRFDTFLLGYSTRDLLVDPRFAREVNAGGGIIHPAVLVDGRVVGTWRVDAKNPRRGVAVQPFRPLPVESVERLKHEAKDVARFLGRQLGFTLLPSYED
jgi:hypothetical protein